MHDKSRSHLRLVGNPETSDGLAEVEDHDRGQLSALKALADATSAEEAFEALQSEELKPVRLGQRREHGRNYESLFGTIRVDRLGYGGRGQQSIHPLDEELNLPGRKYSYAVQERGARRCGRGPFDEALDELETTSAILRIRALDKSGDWDEYWKFHMEQERQRLYATPWKVAA